MARKIIEPILIDSMQSIMQNLEQHIDNFKKNAVVVFRGALLSRSEQLLITKLFGDHIGWYPNSSIDEEIVWSYEEDHSHTMNMYNKHDIKKDELFLPWHLEHMGHHNPAIGATWNMEKFTCEYGIGNTLFVNISDIYDMLSSDDAEFLKKCKVAAFYGLAMDEPGCQAEPTLHDAVEMYEPSGRHALRLSALFKYDRETYYLHSFDGRQPSDEEGSRFMDLSLFFTNQIHHNEAIQHVHMWNEGDLIVVDLFLMAHAVLGGFRPEQRFFYGCWAHRKPGSKYN
jgi:alpha-ketoglutarate-dependent taurine dioxygenase